MVCHGLSQLISNTSLFELELLSSSQSLERSACTWKSFLKHKVWGLINQEGSWGPRDPRSLWPWIGQKFISATVFMVNIIMFFQFIYCLCLEIQSLSGEVECSEVSGSAAKLMDKGMIFWRPWRCFRLRCFGEAEKFRGDTGPHGKWQSPTYVFGPSTWSNQLMKQTHVFSIWDCRREKSIFPFTSRSGTQKKQHVRKWCQQLRMTF